MLHACGSVSAVPAAGAGGGHVAPTDSSSTSIESPSIDSPPSMSTRSPCTVEPSWSTPNPICSTCSGPKLRWMTIHHGPFPSPARSDHFSAPPAGFSRASAGLNCGRSGVLSPPPGPLPPPDAASPSTPCATALSPPDALATATPRSASSSLPPAAWTPCASMSSSPYRATDPIDRPPSSSGPLDRSTRRPAPFTTTAGDAAML